MTNTMVELSNLPKYIRIHRMQTKVWFWQSKH
jgi:hypothetical protein